MNSLLKTENLKKSYNGIAVSTVLLIMPTVMFLLVFGDIETLKRIFILGADRKRIFSIVFIKCILNGISGLIAGVIFAFLSAGIFNTVLLKVFSVNVSIKITAMPCIIGAGLNMAVCLISSALISAYSVKTAAVLGVLVFTVILLNYLISANQKKELFLTLYRIGTDKTQLNRLIVSESFIYLFIGYVISLPLTVFFTFLFESAEHFGTVILRSVCVFAILAFFFWAMSLYNKKRMSAEIGK